jgi:HEAT repeat protein
MAAVSLSRIAPRDERAGAALLEALRSDEAGLRAAGMLGASLLGKSAVPALLEVLRSEDAGRSLEAAEALGADRGPGQAALLELVGQETGALRLRAAVGLARGEGNEEKAAPLVREALASRDEKLQVAAARALGQLLRRGARSGDPAPTCAALRTALGDRSAAVRAAAAASLWEARRIDAELAKVLEGALADPDTAVRASACRTIASHAGRDPEPGGSPPWKAPPDVLVRLLRDEALPTRRAAGWSLAQFGRLTDLAIEALAAALRDADDEVRRRAALALGEGLRRGEGHGPPVAALGEALRDRNPRVRACAAWALVRAKGAAAPVISGLREALDDHETPVRRYAAEALGGIGPPAAAALTGLERLQEDPDQGVSSAALTAVARIGPDPARVVRLLLKDLDDPALPRRLLDLGPRAVPALREALLRGGHDRATVAAALAGLGTEGAAALIHALREGNEPVRLAAVKAMAGQMTGENVEALCVALEDRSVAVRLAAIDGLQVAASRRMPAAAIEALVRVLDDQDREVRSRAAVVLAHLSIEGDTRRARLLAVLDETPLPESAATGGWVCAREVALLWRAEELERRGEAAKALAAYEGWKPLGGCDSWLGHERRVRRARGIATLRMGRGEVDGALAVLEHFFRPEQMEIRPEQVGELGTLHAELCVRAGRFDTALERAGTMPHGLGPAYGLALAAALERRRSGEIDEATRRRIDELLAKLGRPK